ncbi:MAG TPA: response regulator transcription factor [Novosphingobium sp.]|jgi:two-component system phosphate regulon response regulator PhoB|nr:response regulator transcription factor [Novosphingobium sp.]
MRQIDLIVSGELADGMQPYSHGDFIITFHRLNRLSDLPLLDNAGWAFIEWAMPDSSGLEICRRLRCDPALAKIRITMILNEDDQDARRRALSAGADDYMLGPATRRGILDRILANRVHDLAVPQRKITTLGELSIDQAAFQARWQGKPIRLMPNEFRLLRYFVEHPSRVFTRQQLILALGKQEQPMDERTVDVWVGRLRRALRAAGVSYDLRTVRSLGYVFDEP